VLLLFIAFSSYKVQVSYDEAKVVESNAYFYIKAKNPDKIFIYYPGGLVESKAYIPFGILLSEENADVYVIKMPLNLAFLGLSRGADLISDSELPVYLIGHSLGGVAMSLIYEDYMDDIEGLIYLASYPSIDLSMYDIDVLSIYGTQDDVLDMTSYVYAFDLLPSDTEYQVLAGGNHAQFGSYGIQRGDGEACMSSLEQKLKTIEWIITFTDKSEDK
jgi:hypothetical protein